MPKNLERFIYDERLPIINNNLGTPKKLLKIIIVIHWFNLCNLSKKFRYCPPVLDCINFIHSTHHFLL